MEKFTKPVKRYRYDLRALEDQVLSRFQIWKDLDDETTRTNLFLAIKEIAFAILEVGNYAKYKIDHEKTSYEYALYLFDRLVLKQIEDRFEMKPTQEGGRFPVQDYIR